MVTGPSSDVNMTSPTGCFGWCQLVFRDYFTALAHNVDSRALLQYSTNFVDRV